MSEDTFPPPDEEELEAANALRQALEGRPAGSHVPDEALQAAAFLRHTGDGGRLSSERRAKLRAELLASLPAAPSPARRKSWRDWFGIGLTLVGAASAAVTVGVLGVREWSSHDRAREARSEAMETAAYGDEAGAAQRGAAPVAPAPPQLASPTPPAAPMERGASSAGGEPMTGQRALGGVGRAQPALSGGAGPRVTALEASRAAAPGDSAAPSAARKRAQSSEAPGALASKAASAALDAELAQREGSGLGAAQTRGGGAAEAKGGGAAANAAAPAKELDTSDARVARQREQQRSRLLAKLAYTPAPSAYLQADRARSTAELELAREQLTALSGTGLGGASSALEAELLRPDVYCRLAELSLRLGQPRAALDWTRQGLALGSEPSPFVACLYQQQGRAREALGQRDGAAQSYMNALKVNEQLLNESLEGP